jgi:hypothetical protein
MCERLPIRFTPSRFEPRGPDKAGVGMALKKKLAAGEKIA